MGYFLVFFNNFFNHKNKKMLSASRVIPEGDVPMKKLIQLCWA